MSDSINKTDESDPDNNSETMNTLVHIHETTASMEIQDLKVNIYI